MSLHFIRWFSCFDPADLILLISNESHLKIKRFVTTIKISSKDKTRFLAFRPCAVLGCGLFNASTSKSRVNCSAMEVIGRHLKIFLEYQIIYTKVLLIKIHMCPSRIFQDYNFNGISLINTFQIFSVLIFGILCLVGILPMFWVAL